MGAHQRTQGRRAVCRLCAAHSLLCTPAAWAGVQAQLDAVLLPLARQPATRGSFTIEAATAPAAAHTPPCCAAPAACRDTVIYNATCPKLGCRRVAVKVYDKQKVQSTKLRAIKREIAMMMYFSRLKCVGGHAAAVGMLVWNLAWWLAAAGGQ